MKILGVHNYYGNYGISGESKVFESEMDILESNGHSVKKYTCTNYDVYKYSLFRRLNTYASSNWNYESYSRIKKILESYHPDIMHVHNTWLLLTPSILQAAYELNIPSVITLHNYRLACPAGQFLHKGNECDMCLGMDYPWPILKNKCYHNSYAKSLLRFRFYTKPRSEDMWTRKIGKIIALTEFAAKKFVLAGIPNEKITVKPNCIDDPLNNTTIHQEKHKGAVYIGRLSKEKGLVTLIKAWKDIDYPLTIVGDGPLKNELQSLAKNNVKFVGYLGPGETLNILQRSRFIVFPSECYEGFPMALLEAMACGVPIVATRYGAMESILKEGSTGMLFRKGDTADLREVIGKLINNKILREQLGQQARQEYMDKYTNKHNYDYLMDIYNYLAR
jgi:glycosyltransferase involved in cell wall biosynthesis